MAEHKRKILLVCSLVFTASAAIIAGYLLWAATGDRDRVFGCADGSLCDKVLGSRWSLWLGQPVAGIALGFYALFLWCLLALRSSSAGKVGWLPCLVSVATSAGLVILWFIGIQVAVIGSFCVYCLADHALGLLAIACLLIYTKQSGVRPGLAAWLLAPILASGFIAAHIIFEPTRMQVFEIPKVTPPQIDHSLNTRRGADFPIPVKQINETTNPLKSEDPSRRVHLLDDKVHFDIYQIPHIGSSEAEFVIMELFDYTCSHCRELHEHLEAALDRYEDSLTIVALPVPMNSSCNPNITRDHAMHQYACIFAVYSLAVCAVDREQFAPYHNWLMEGKDPPSPEAARSKAEMMIGTGKFESALTNRWIKDWLADGRAMHGLGSTHGIPKLIVGSQIVSVSHIPAEKLFELIETSLGISQSQAEME